MLTNVFKEDTTVLHKPRAAIPTAPLSALVLTVIIFTNLLAEVSYFSSFCHFIIVGYASWLVDLLVLSVCGCVRVRARLPVFMCLFVFLYVCLDVCACLCMCMRV